MALPQQIRVEARVVLASNRLRLRELLRLERGSVVPLAGDADAPSLLHVNGVAVALGEVQIDGDRTAFEVRDMVARG